MLMNRLLNVLLLKHNIQSRSDVLFITKASLKKQNKKLIACLERSMILWSEGKIEKFISEGKCIQKHLTSNATAEMEMEKIARDFNRLVLRAKARQVSG